MSLLLALASGAPANSQALAVTLDGVGASVSQTARHAQSLAATLDDVVASVGQSVAGTVQTRSAGVEMVRGRSFKDLLRRLKEARDPIPDAPAPEAPRATGKKAKAARAIELQAARVALLDDLPAASQERQLRELLAQWLPLQPETPQVDWDLAFAALVSRRAQAMREREQDEEEALIALLI